MLKKAKAPDPPEANATLNRSVGYDCNLTSILWRENLSDAEVSL